MEDQIEESWPRYRQIAEQLSRAIELGTLCPDQRFPSLRQLMRSYSISLSTAVATYRLLESQGWAEARDRSGYFVVNHGNKTQLKKLNQPIVEPLTESNIRLACTADILLMMRNTEVSADFAVASCAPELYPAEELRKLMMAVIRDNERILTLATSAPSNNEFKSALARRALLRGINVSPEEIIVTHGASEGLALALRAVTKSGDAVLLESPTYYGVLQLLNSLGVKAIELPTSKTTGLLPEAVEFALREHPRVVAVVNMPTLHNPLGSTMSNDNKRKLVELCVAHKVALIEDDVYGELHPDACRLQAQKAWDKTGHVIYCSSLNKTLSPGMRLGWLLPGRWRSEIEKIQSSQSRPRDNLPQLVAARFLSSSSYDRHLKRLHASLVRMRKNMIELIRQSFPEGCEIDEANAGLILWIKLPNGVSSLELFKKALENRIRILPGAIFSGSSYFDNYIRLTYGWPLTQERAAALEKVGQLCHQLALSNKAKHL